MKRRLLGWLLRLLVNMQYVVDTSINVQTFIGNGQLVLTLDHGPE